MSQKELTMTRLKNGYGRHKKNIQIMTIEDQIVAKVGLGNKKTTLISLCDIDILLEHSFYGHKRKDGKYVARSNTNGAYLHRLLMDPSNEQEVDHVDANPLNNTRGNLRRCSPRQNNLAKVTPLIGNMSGIHQTKWKWYKAFDGEGKKVGKFRTPIEAGKARDELMIEAYFHSHSEEELHTYSFINWNFDSPQKANESEDYLFDQIQDAQVKSYDLLQEHNWQA